MTDFDFEVSEKRKIARSARYKINGSKSRKCTLATDYMTPSQIRKMNGETISYNLNKPMTLEEFKKVPPAAGREYVLGLVDLYGCNFTSLSRMFGCSRKACSQLLSSPPYEIRFNRGCAMSKKKQDMWNAFLGESKPFEEPASLPEAENEIKNLPSVSERNDDKQEEEDRPSAMKMDRFTLSFSGRLSVEAIANSLRLILGDGTSGTLTIKYHIGGDFREQ